jgi:branched-chain amino acid transport system ATP-binding protein
LVLGLLLLVSWLDWRTVHSRVGRAITVLGADHRVGQAFGVNRVGYSVLAFVLSGFEVGLAGALWAGWEQLVVPGDWGYQLGLTFLIMVVIAGGIRRSGVIIASVFFGIFGYVLTQITPLVNAVGTTNLAYFVPAIGGVLLVVTLVLTAEHQHDGRPGPIPKTSAVVSHKVTTAASLARDEQATAVGPGGAEGTPRRPVGEREVPLPRYGAPVLLKSEALTVAFGGLEVLSGVSFEVRRGEIVGLVGPNGAGKTTCFNCVSGFLRADRGQVLFDGTDISRLPPHRRAALGMARTFQQIGLAKDATVLENLLIAQHLRGGYRLVSGMLGTPTSFRMERVMRQRAEELIEEMELTDAAHKRISELPYGLRKTTELAAAMASEPRLLLLDEPTSGMGLDEGRELCRRLRYLRDRTGVTVLLVEHHIPLVAELCDFIYVLDAGVILTGGDAASVQRDERVITVYLGKGFAA